MYESGVPPAETRFSQTSALYLSRGRVQNALEQAQEGIASDPQNPLHYYLAGVARIRLDQYGEADRMFARAEEIYPAYEVEIEPQREAAWAAAFNAGTEAYTQGDVEGAVEAWRRAIIIYDRRPESYRNLAGVLSSEGRYDEAIQVYEEGRKALSERPASRVLKPEEVEARDEARAEVEERLVQLLLFRKRFEEALPLLQRQLEHDSTDVRARAAMGRALAGLGRNDEATRIYSSLLSERELQASELLNLGTALFRAGEYTNATRAFERLTKLRPESRDAWFNYANSLFAAQEWQKLAAIGDRLLELDPLGEDSALIVARALLESGDVEGAQRGVDRSDAAPVHVAGLQMQPAAGVTTVHGTVVGSGAVPETPVCLRFTFYREDQTLGTETVEVAAPPQGKSAAFEVSFQKRADAYRYEVVR